MRIDRWARVAESTLYSLLRRLQESGALNGEVESGERHGNRTVYRLTDAGRQRLGQLVDQGLASPAPIYSDRLVAALFSANAGGDVSLDQAIARLYSERDRMQALAQASETSRPGRVIIRFYIDVICAEIRVLETLLEIHETAPD